MREVVVVVAHARASFSFGMSHRADLQRGQIRISALRGVQRWAHRRHVNKRNRSFIVVRLTYKNTLVNTHTPVV